jgi:hypothetical protein
MILNKKLSKELIDSGYKYADKKNLDLYYITNARLSFFKSDFLNCIKFYELAIKNSKYENNIINLKKQKNPPEGIYRNLLLAKPS